MHVLALTDLPTVAGRLGHGSGGATTLKVYAAWVDVADRRAATTMADIMPTPVPVHRPRGAYETLAAALRAEIESGHLKPGDELPTVVQIAAASPSAPPTEP